MSTYQVIVEVTMLATYTVQAETEREAQKQAVERAHDGMGMQGWDVQSADVWDTTDETDDD